MILLCLVLNWCVKNSSKLIEHSVPWGRLDWWNIPYHDLPSVWLFCLPLSYICMEHMPNLLICCSTKVKPFWSAVFVFVLFCAIVTVLMSILHVLVIALYFFPRVYKWKRVKAFSSKPLINRALYFQHWAGLDTKHSRRYNLILARLYLHTDLATKAHEHKQHVLFGVLLQIIYSMKWSFNLWAGFLVVGNVGCVCILNVTLEMVDNCIVC